MPIRDIKDHLERSDARIERSEKLEAVREYRRLIALNIRLAVGVIAVMCAVSAIYNQF